MLSIEARQERQDLTGHETVAEVLATDGRYVAAGQIGGVAIWELDSAEPGYRLAGIADPVLTIAAPSNKIAGNTGFKSIQPLGSLFEQSLLLALDGIVLLLMETTGEDPAVMFRRHANLE